MIVLPLKVHKRVVSKFKREAKRVFPKEHFCYLLGHEQDGFLEVTDLWLPEDIEKHATPCSVTPPESWGVKVLEYCEENDLTPLGTLHSHPYQYHELHKNGAKLELPDHAPSEGDANHGLIYKVHGICRILESKNKRLTATIRFWGPALKMETSLV